MAGVLIYRQWNLAKNAGITCVSSSKFPVSAIIYPQIFI